MGDGMSMTRMYWLGAFLGVSFAGQVARADVAPPPGYVERCTLEKSCPLGQECVLCPADFGTNKLVCEHTLQPLGFAKQCQSRGASVWDEVWCRPVSDDDAGTDIEIVAADAGTPNTDFRFNKSTPVVVCKPGADSGGCGCAIAAGGEARGAAKLGLTSSVFLLGVFGARRRAARRQRPR
jgi:hypothetical protein